MDDEKYADGVARLLTPGERLLAVAEARMAYGLAPPEPQGADKSETSSAKGPGFLGVLLNLISPTVAFSAGDRLVDLIVYGVAGRGAPGSYASQMRYSGWHRTTRERGLRLTMLAVTDQRLLLCRTGPVKVWSDREDDQAVAGMEMLWSAPRAAVAGARVGWHRLNPKRLRIDFTDGSWLSFTVPLAEPGRSLRAIAAALTGRGD